jgi:hypothetical protein
MKYKIKFKAIDNANKELELVEEFYKDKPDFTQYDSYSSDNVRVINFRENGIGYVVSVNYKDKLVIKALQSDLTLMPFTKEELKFFDMLDYDIHEIAVKEIKQTITSWVGMKDEV